MSTVITLDIGNTRTHLARMEGDRVAISTAVPTADVIHNPAVLDAWAGLHDADGFAFCSVVPDATAALRPWLDARNRPVFHLTANCCPGLPIHYPKPQEIGQDRLANALGASQRYGSPAVVIDMGTAVTFDIVSRSGGYEGGIIAPGLEVMTRYLHEQTALLPELDASQLVVSEIIGKSTRSAMSTGCAIGFTGMIRALLEEVKTALAAIDATSPNVVITGGSAGTLPKQWLSEIHYDPDLTLHGLRIGFERWSEK